jgi:Fe-S-cluster-containing dehydrogenase component
MRRNIIQVALAALVGMFTQARKAGADDENDEVRRPFHAGCLVDTTLCMGCRKCEAACSRRNGLPAPESPASDTSVFRRERRPDKDAFTVVNQYPGAPSPDQPHREHTTVKVQCMHCLVPSCVSACVVGALAKAPDGAVVYDPAICMGCRYCLVACPFGIPAYEFFNALTPRVRKCEFCFDAASASGANPACAAACPTEALVFGDRGELLTLAHEKIRATPFRYDPHVYGENEVGGTSWLYLTGRPAGEIGLLPLPAEAPAVRTEAIQHGIFKYGAIPLTLYGTLGGIMWLNHRRTAPGSAEAGEGRPCSKGEVR